MKRYFALLDGERDAYGVAFPDCPGCTAMGADENEAYLNAIDALGEWMHDARLADVAPEPRSIEALRSATQKSKRRSLRARSFCPCLW
jgi:predicted RNase H-like HicB family nuclease